MCEKFYLIPVPVEQLTHELAIARIYKLNNEQTETPSDMLEQYLEGVALFKLLIENYQDIPFKN